jgi:hypothetical protein
MEKEIIGGISINLEKLGNGEIIHYLSCGFSPWGFRQIRYNSRRKELRHEGCDGTGNQFFFAKFNKKISLRDAVSIMSYEEFVKLCNLCDVDDEDEIADAYNSVQENDGLNLEEALEAIEEG